MVPLRRLLSRFRRSPPEEEPEVPFRVGGDAFELLKRELSSRENPRILEIGSREVTGENLRELMELGAHEYTGFDYHPGPGVDVVGDVHELSRHVAHEQFDAVVSKSVFEHLALPWVAVLEINKVLRVGGVCFINTFQTFPLHETPWDFFRFSDNAWYVLFNRWTGFEVLAAGMNTPCRVVHRGQAPEGWVDSHTAYINSDIVVRKLGPYDQTRLRWDLTAADVLEAPYPEPAGADEPPPSGQTPR